MCIEISLNSSHHQIQVFQILVFLNLQLIRIDFEHRWHFLKLRSSVANDLQNQLIVPLISLINKSESKLVDFLLSQVAVLHFLVLVILKILPITNRSQILELLLQRIEIVILTYRKLVWIDRLRIHRVFLYVADEVRLLFFLIVLTQVSQYQILEFQTAIFAEEGFSFLVEQKIFVANHAVLEFAL